MHEPGIFSARDYNDSRILHLNKDKNYIIGLPDYFKSKSQFPHILYNSAIYAGFRKEYAYELAYS